MPFSLTNAPSTFQSLMNDVFNLLVFFDDILVFSPTLELHLQHLRTVLKLLLQHQLYAKRSKCVFGCSEVEYLSHIISGQGVSTDLRKIVAMVAWPSLTSVKALKGFLGLTSYYRKFIWNYDQIAAPFTKLLKKNSFVQSVEVEKAFQQLKGFVSQPSILALPDFDHSFTIECDASRSGLRAVLMQNHRPIAFHSQLLKGKALQLSTYEKELLALVTVVHKWRPYLLSRPFIIKTNQQSLKYILEQSITTLAQQKWLTKLLGYLFVVEYKQGCENKVANALSRRLDYVFEDPTTLNPFVNSPSLFLIFPPCPSWIEELKASYQLSLEMQQLLQQL